MMNSRPLIKEQKDQHVLPISGNWILHPYRKYTEKPDAQAIIRSAHEGTKLFWDEWITHVPRQLFQYKKWKEMKPNPKVGDTVLIVRGGYGNQKAARKYWPQGKIVECIESRDGIIRKVKIKLPNGKIENNIVQNLVIVTPNEYEINHQKKNDNAAQNEDHSSATGGE